MSLYFVKIFRNFEPRQEFRQNAVKKPHQKFVLDLALDQSLPY